MNQTDTNIIINSKIIPYIDCSISGTGIIAVFIAIHFEKLSIAIFSILLTIIALIHSVANLTINETKIVSGIIATDSICSVLLTLAIAFTLRLHKTPIGVFRILWLILLVTSSSSYATISAFTGQTFLPNDITFVAIAVSTIILICMSIYAKCKRINTPYEANTKHIISEYALVIGALCLRFENEIFRIILIKIGWISWHLSCWISSSVCCTITYPIIDN